MYTRSYTPLSNGCTSVCNQRLVFITKGSVNEKSSRFMCPSTYPYRRKIKKRVGPKTLNSRKSRFLVRTVNLTERGQKFCSNGQQAKVDRSSR